MEVNDRKTNSKEIANCSVLSSAACTTLHAYIRTYVTLNWKTILNHIFHVLEMLV